MIALIAATIITMTLPTQNVSGQVIPQSMELVGLVYECAGGTFSGYAFGAPGEQITVAVAEDYGCWYARAQFLTGGFLISDQSERVYKVAPCSNCHQ